MLARASALLLAAGAARAQSHHDPFAGSGCDCDTFCAGSCAINATGKQTITLYRMTPLHVDGLMDKNTGDARGDTSYVMGRRTTAYDCQHITDPSRAWSCATLVVKGDDPDSTDLVIAFTVEVDGNWGPYLYCNPTDAKHPEEEWKCTTNPMSSAGGKPPANYPETCTAANYTGADKYCFTNKPSKTVSGVDLGGCCDAAKTAGSWFQPRAYGYTYFAGNQTCNIYDGYHNTASGCDDGVTGHYEQTYPGHSACDCPKVHASVGRENLTQMTSGYNPSHHSSGSSLFIAGGEWYSTPREGQCKDGQEVGDGCSWKNVGVAKAVNTTCIYDRIDSAIVNRDQDCFSQCPKANAGTPWVYNRTSTCYSQCYSQVTQKMTGEEMAQPWALAFASNENGKGGCPSVDVPKSML